MYATSPTAAHCLATHQHLYNPCNRSINQGSPTPATTLRQADHAHMGCHNTNKTLGRLLAGLTQKATAVPETWDYGNTPGHASPCYKHLSATTQPGCVITTQAPGMGRFNTTDTAGAMPACTPATWLRPLWCAWGCCAGCQAPEEPGGCHPLAKQRQRCHCCQ